MKRIKANDKADDKANAQVRVTLKVGEAAKLAGCGQRAIRNGVEEGFIPHLRLGRNILIPRAAFLQWIESAALKSGGQGQR